jgi:hypothetical protein
VRHRLKDSEGGTTEGSTAVKSQDGKAGASSKAPPQHKSGSSKLSVRLLPLLILLRSPTLSPVTPDRNV